MTPVLILSFCFTSNFCFFRIKISRNRKNNKKRGRIQEMDVFVARCGGRVLRSIGICFRLNSEGGVHC